MAKCTSFWQVSSYRSAYSLYCCTGILANHESPLRQKRFVTQKIISTVKAISAGHEVRLRLGNLDIWRDWGWAPEYVEAMHLLLQQEAPCDYNIATGHTNSLKDFVELAFSAVGLSAADYLDSDQCLMRPSDLRYSAVDPSRIQLNLGWKAKLGLKEIISRMLSEDC